MTSRRWLTIFITLLAVFMAAEGILTGCLDPFFHYHAPLDGYYYVLGDQRYQNDGITRNFSYDAMITGTSMVENFRTSEFDGLFGTNSVKIPYPGATFKEINDNLSKGLETHTDADTGICSVRYVLRALDMTHLVEDKDAMRTDMGDYPTYLYDANPFNDVKYLYNAAVFFEYLLPMLGRKITGSPAGMTSFDDYGWSGDDEYSASKALAGKTGFEMNENDVSDMPGLTDEEKQTLHDNIEANVVATAQEYPGTTFILFFPPYSAAWYGENLENGTFNYFLEAEELAARQLLECDNVRLFTFSSDTSVTCNMNNYKDVAHYSPAINSRILQEMAGAVRDGTSSTYEVTMENCDTVFRMEREIYQNLDYNALMDQALELE